MKIKAVAHGKEFEYDISFRYDDEKIATKAIIEWDQDGEHFKEEAISILGDRDNKEGRYSKIIGRKVALARAMKVAGLSVEHRTGIWEALKARGMHLFKPKKKENTEKVIDSYSKVA